MAPSTQKTLQVVWKAWWFVFWFPHRGKLDPHLFLSLQKEHTCLCSMVWGQGQSQSSILMLSLTLAVRKNGLEALHGLSIRENITPLGQSAAVDLWDIYLEPRKPLYASW